MHSSTKSSNIKFQLALVTFDELPGWKADDHSALIPAFLKSCKKWEKRPLVNQIGKLPEMGTIRDWLEICKKAEAIKKGNSILARYFFESQFQPYVYVNLLRRPTLNY